MTVFRFGLEQVLRYRKQLEEAAMQELARAQNALLAHEAYLHELREDLAREQARLSHASEMTSEERWLSGSYVTGLTQDIKAAVERRAALEEETDKARNALVQRAQDSKLLEKLKSRQQERFLRIEQLREQKEHDEIATLRFVPSAR